MQYKINTAWKRNSAPFNKQAYDRTHTVTFSGGLAIEASSAAEFAGNAKLPNPEELFAAAISSCFMLTFLFYAASKGLVVNDYSDNAVATLAKNAEGKMAVTEVILQPKITFEEDKKPDAATLQQLLKQAHDYCFISNSVKTTVQCRVD